MPDIIIKNVNLCLPSGIEPGALTIEDGKIKDVFAGGNIDAPGARIVDGGGAYAAPGFIDLHIHGFGGFGTEDMTEQSLLEMSVFLAKRGVVAFCPTLYPAAKEVMLRNVRALVPAIGKERGAKILGFHIEGPFISPQKPGVMKPGDISPVDMDFMTELYLAALGNIKIMTFAPEVPGSHELIKFAKEKNILLSIGHTNATYEEMLLARTYGVKHVTHIFNAMSAFNHRAPGAAGAAMMGDFSVEIIADGVHVHPAIISFLGKIKNPGAIVLVTDSLKPTMQSGASLKANAEEVVLKDGVFRRVKDDVIAGSALTSINGVRNLVSWGFSMESAVRAASENPAKILGLKEFGVLQSGARADITIFDSTFDIKAVFIDGREVEI